MQDRATDLSTTPLLKPDYYANGCDRNAHVDWVEFVGAETNIPPPPNSGSIYFQDRFERSFNSANMSGSGSVSANNGLVPAWDWGNAAASDRIMPSTSVVRAGSQSSKWTVYNGDRSPKTMSENPRARLNYDGGTKGRFCEGDERWIAYSMYFPSSFTDHKSGDWTSLQSIGWGHPYRSTPAPIFVTAENNGGPDCIRILLNNSPTWGETTRWSENIQRGQWYDLTFHIKFSRNASVGYVEFWRNGVQQMFNNGVHTIFMRTLHSTNSPYCGNLQVSKLLSLRPGG